MPIRMEMIRHRFLLAGARRPEWSRVWPRSILPAAGLAAAAAIAATALLPAGTSPLARLQARLHLKEGNRQYLVARYEEAIRCYDLALEREPRCASACLNRAYSLEGLCRMEENLEECQELTIRAVGAFERYLDLEGDRGRPAPSGQPVLSGGAARQERAALEGRPAFREHPGRERIEEHILALWIGSRMHDQAVAHLEARWQRDPGRASTLDMLARLEVECGRPEEALRWQRLRIDATPNDPEALCNLGVLAWRTIHEDDGLESGRREALLGEGFEALERALALHPDHVEALMCRNLLFREKAKHARGDAERIECESQARMAFERALSLSGQEASSPGGAGVKPGEAA